MIYLLDEAAPDAVSVRDAFDSAFEAQIHVEGHGELIGFKWLVMHVVNSSLDVIFVLKYRLIRF